jgi:hypothetical protein
MSEILSFDALFKNLVRDTVRDDTPFSETFDEAHRALLSSHDQVARESLMGQWLRRYQPCLFGRIAAKEGLISYCFLTEHDLSLGRQHVQDAIQAARLEWTRAAYQGQKSAFVICLLSDDLARATPDQTVLSLAMSLASLYLLTAIRPDEIYLEEVFLEMPSFARTTWRWSAGVNYFSAHADGRWWQDHRIPGGIALSVNSVGHLVKSSAIGRAQQTLAQSLDIQGDPWLPTKVDSLGEALEFAMRTIDLATDAASGRATWLNSAEAGERCPITLPPNLEGKSCTQYGGYYHTDITLPSEYFQPDVLRPERLTAHRLDFTYLSSPSVENPDNMLMGSGRQIRAATSSLFPGSPRLRRTPDGPRLSRSQPSVRAIAECERLLLAIKQR